MNAELLELLEKLMGRKLREDELAIAMWLSNCEYIVPQTLIAMLRERIGGCGNVDN